MKPSNLLTRRRRGWAAVLLVMLLAVSLTGQTGATGASGATPPSAPSPLAPGDENWDNRFDVLGMNGDVHAIAISGTDVYAGGDFTSAGGVPANNIAKWDGSGWSPLGSGVNPAQVYSLAISGTDVYVGGFILEAGEVPANNIAKWDGSSWSALGSGVDGSDPLTSKVYAIAISGSDVYAGGRFRTAGGLPANGIAKWDGSSWSPLGSGLNGAVFAIATGGSNVYVGGPFSTAGGVPTNSIAKWDGSNWSALGSGLNGAVFAIATGGSNVYVGGNFSTAGGVPASNIAKWDGSSWSALGSGLNSRASTIAISGSDLYAGGDFTTAGGVSANRVAKWNGSSWSPLGSGITGPPSSPGVFAIATSGSNVYVGGDFHTAGVNPSNSFAIWHIPPVKLVGHVNWAGQSQPNALQQRPITLTLCSTSGGPSSAYSGTTDASGYFTINVASLISGTYNWRVKGPRSLANGGMLALTGSDQQVEMGAQNGGDADNDNAISISDFNIMKSTFGRAQGDPDYDERGDFDNSSNVNITDFNIQKSNFGQAGAPVTCP